MSRDQQAIFLVKVVEDVGAAIVMGASTSEFGAKSLAQQLLRYERWRISTVWKIRDAAMYGPDERKERWECVAHFERDEHNRIIQIVGDVPDFIKGGAST